MKSFIKNFTILGLMLFVLSSVALATVGVKFTPVSVSVPSGSDFSFNVELYSDVGEDISSYNVLLKYDPAMVTAKSVQDETFTGFSPSSNVGFDKDAALISQLTLSGKINVPKNGIKVATVVFSTKTGLALGKSSSITVSPAFGDFAVVSATGGLNVADISLAKELVVTIAQAQDPSIAVIYPTTAALNETLIIRGSNFGSAPIVSVGGKQIVNYIKQSDTEIIALLPVDAAISNGITKVQVKNTSTNKLSNEYSQNVNIDTLVIDDIEGGHVNQDSDPAKYGYYKYKDPNGAIIPIVDTATKLYGNKSLKMQYSYVNGTWGDGAGAALLNQNLDLSNYNALSFSYIGDGTDNFMRVDIIEADGDQWMGQLIPLKPEKTGTIFGTTPWTSVVLPLDDKSFVLDTAQSIGDKLFSKKIKGYKFTYVPGTPNNTTTKYHYIDQVQAIKVSTDNKTTLISVDPLKLSFTAVKGKTLPAKQNINLANILGKITNYSMIIRHYGQKWFDLAPVNPNNFDFGTYTLYGQEALGAGANKVFDVAIKDTNLPVGDHTAQVVFIDELGKSVTVNIVYTITSQNIPLEPNINSVIPSSAYRGGTIKITGSNLSGTKLTVGGIEVTPFAASDTELKAIVPTTLSGEVKVKIEKNAKTSEANLKVSTDFLVIDDIEGGHVAQKANLAKDGYSSLSHNKDGAQDPKPVTTEKMEQEKSLELQFGKIDGKSGDGVGAALINENLDLKDYSYISFFIKGDGTNNVAHFEIEEAADAALGNDAVNKKGEIWRSNAKIELKNTAWRRVVIKLDEANFSRIDYYIGNSKLDKNIRGYKLSYYDSNTDKNVSGAKHYVDSLFAATEKDSISVVTIDPKDISFKANKNGAAPEVKKVVLANTGTKSMVVNISANQPTWLQVAPATITIAAGKTAELSAQIIKTDLEAKIYTGTIKVIDELALEQNVNVTYTVIDPNAPAKIGVTPTTIDVESAPDGSAIVRNIALSNVGGGTLSYKLANTNPWLTASKASGSLASGVSDVLALTIDPKGLAAGAYTDTVVITNNDDTKDAVSISVKLTVKSVVTADPKLDDIFPSQAYPGSTILISGENLKGGKVKVNGKEAKVFFDSNNLLKAVVPHDTAAGTAKVEVTVNGKTVSKDITIADSGAIIDDMEGGHASAYFDFSDPNTQGATKPELNQVEKNESIQSLRMQYIPVGDSSVWGDGGGASLNNTAQNISKYPAISFWLKGDGSDNIIRLELKEAKVNGGEVWSGPDFSLKDTNWHKVEFKVTDLKLNKDGGPTVNSVFDKVIDGYNLVYIGKNNNPSSAYSYVDFIIAGAADIPLPTKPIITANPQTLEHQTTVSDTKSVNYELEVKNTGAGTLKYTASIKDAGATWLKIDTKPIDLAASQSQKLIVTFDPSQVARAENVYETYIVVEDPSAFNKKVEVKVTLKVSNVINLGLPEITSITPAFGPIGTEVVILGKNFDFSDRRYKDFARVVFNKQLNLENVRVISPTEVRAIVPMNSQPGKYTVYFNRRDATGAMDVYSAETDKMFEVTALTTVTDVYPNPVNPLAPTDNKATIRITLLNPGNVAIYIFDITGRMVWQKQSYYAAGTHEVAWDAKVLDGDLVGDGVYLVRVMNSDTKALISKGKIVVIKQ